MTDTYNKSCTTKFIRIELNYW